MNTLSLKWTIAYKSRDMGNPVCPLSCIKIVKLNKVSEILGVWAKSSEPYSCMTLGIRSGQHWIYLINVISNIIVLYLNKSELL